MPIFYEEVPEDKSDLVISDMEDYLAVQPTDNNLVAIRDDILAGKKWMVDFITEEISIYGYENVSLRTGASMTSIVGVVKHSRTASIETIYRLAIAINLGDKIRLYGQEQFAKRLEQTRIRKPRVRRNQAGRPRLSEINLYDSSGKEIGQNNTETTPKHQGTKKKK